MKGSPEQDAPKKETIDDILSPEKKEELRLARRSFAQIERVTQLMTGYPPGHPMVEEGVEELNAVFYELFEFTDRLTVEIYPHWMHLYGTNEMVWETQEPKDYCFALNRDGLYLLHILAGVTSEELQRFVEVLNDLIDERNLNRDAVSMLFDAGFRNIHWEAIDESLARLAGLDMKDRDTPEEQEKVDDLFGDAFAEDEWETGDDDETMEGDFEIRLQNRSARQTKLEIGSRNFLELSEEAQEHLKALRRGFREHNELEHRQGEVLSAVLGAKPRRKLRKGAVEQIGKVMGELLETNEPWEALAFLKLIHQWRDKFQPAVAGELKEVVRDCFSERRIRLLAKRVTTSDKGGRRAILQMFDALHLESASVFLAELLAWELEEEARNDIVRYLRKQARHGLGFIEESLPKLPGDKAGPLVQIVTRAMPRSRPILVGLLKMEVEPGLKIKALHALRGTWDDPIEIRDYLVPLIKGSNSKLRVEAVTGLGESAPQHVYRVLEPLFTPALAKRPDEEVAVLVRVFVTKGKRKAVDRLEELVKRRGVVSEDEKDLAIKVVQALIKVPTPAIVELLKTVAGDWLVAGRIRSTCKEVVELLER